MEAGWVAPCFPQPITSQPHCFPATRPCDRLCTDASQHFKLSLRGDLRGAVSRLNGSSSLGLVHCGPDCGTPSGRYLRMLPFHEGLARASGIPLPRLMVSRETLTTNLLWAASPQNLELAEAWLQLALSDPSAFCGSTTQDQAAFSALAVSRSLPLLDPCAHANRGCGGAAAGERRSDRPVTGGSLGICSFQEKSLDWVLDSISYGAYAVTIAGSPMERADHCTPTSTLNAPLVLQTRPGFAALGRE